MANIIAITSIITPNAMYISLFALLKPQFQKTTKSQARACLPSLHASSRRIDSVRTDILTRMYLLPKNVHLAEAAAVGGWGGGAWELELNHM
jgi:hypothetical protein